MLAVIHDYISGHALTIVVIAILAQTTFMLLWLYNTPGPILNPKKWCLRLAKGNSAGALAIYFGAWCALGVVSVPFTYWLSWMVAD